MTPLPRMSARMGPWLAAGALWTVASVGSAAVPEGVVPVAAPEGVQEAYAAWLASSGAPPGKLACVAGTRNVA